MVNKKDNRGWVRLIEVFIAIFLISGVLLLIANKTSSKEEFFSATTSEQEIAILRNIQLNYTLRTEILNVNSLPIEWEDFSDEIPNVKNRIVELIPSTIDCKAKLCLINDTCVLDELAKSNIYAEAVVISADLNTYSPRQLKLFCSEEEVN